MCFYAADTIVMLADMMCAVAQGDVVCDVGYDEWVIRILICDTIPVKSFKYRMR